MLANLQHTENWRKARENSVFMFQLSSQF